MCVAKCLCQRFRRSGNRDKMNVIGHEAPGDDTDIVARVLAKDLDVTDSVLIGEEDILSIVAALGDMMRRSGEHEARSAWHAG